MTLQEFESLTTDQKLSFLLQSGKYIGGKTHNDLSTNLYAIGDFFCEVSYNLDQSSIQQLKAFSNTDRVIPYLFFD